MDSNFDFPIDITFPPTLDRIHRGERIWGALPKKHDPDREEPGRKGSDDTSPEGDDGTEKHQIDLMV